MSNIADRTEVELFVNGEQAEKAMERLKDRADDLSKAIDAAVAAGDKKEETKLRKELRQIEKEMNRTESAAKGTGIVLNDLSNTSIHGLNNALKYLQKQLNVTKPNTEQWQEYAEQIRVVKDRIAELKEELKGQSAWKKFEGWASRAWSGIDLIVRGYDAAVNAISEYVDAYASMDQEMANVRKFTGLTEAQVADLNEEFKKMDTRTSREDLNKLAQEAGRLGKTSKEDIMGFVKAADVINVALDDLGDGATLTLSKLTGVFGDEARYGTEQSLLKVGSVINELSQNCAASAPYLADFTSRMGGVGAQANMTIPQIMAFGAVLDSNGQAVEASATALSQVIVRMMQQPAKYAKVAGLDVKKFSDMLKTDVNGALIMFLETLQQAGGMGTQVDIAEKIIAKEGHYFLAVKENQGNLLYEIQDVMKYNKPTSSHEETEKDHARVERRTVSICPAEKMEDKDVLARWQQLRTLVRIDTHTVYVSENGREESNTRYYISDEDFPSAAYYGALTRGHWAVENGLHWHLDVTFKEDDCRARRDNAAQNLSLLRKLVLQVVKATKDKLSMRKRLVKAAMDKDYLRILLKNYGF